ncbi:MAG: helix-turn-helix domain-containing protein [Planctomycetota bacterium]|jgi:hypothetical protein
MAGRKKFQTDHADPFVERLEKAREKLGHSQRRMARELGVPFRTYQKWLYADQKPRHGSAILSRAEAMVTPRRTNCWEVVHCGREPGGKNTGENGVCPAARDEAADGVNSGANGGRVCWAISGTFCGRQADGSEATRFISCLICDFFTQVLQEEGLANFKLLKPGQSYTQT